MKKVAEYIKVKVVVHHLVCMMITIWIGGDIAA